MSKTPLVVERVLAAPPDEVFAAWSDAASLRTWMCPGEMTAQAEVDFQVGGGFRIVMHGDRDYVQYGEYLEIDPPKRIVFTWISEFVPEPESQTRVRVELEPEGEDRTRIRLTHEALPDTNTYDGHEEGWTTILAKLARHCEGE